MRFLDLLPLRPFSSHGPRETTSIQILVSLARHSLRLASDTIRGKDPIINDGAFHQVGFDFIIIACVIFAPVKQITRFKSERSHRQRAGPTNEEQLLREIRRALPRLV